MTKLWRLLEHPVAMILITALCVLFFVSLHRGGGKLQSSAQSLDQIEAEIERLQEQNQELVDEIEQSQTPLAQEKMIRDELLMQKPGEVVVQLGEVQQLSADTQKVDREEPLQAWKELLL